MAEHRNIVDRMIGLEEKENFANLKIVLRNLERIIMKIIRN